MTTPVKQKVKVIEIYRASKPQRLYEKGVLVSKEPGDVVDVTDIHHTQLRRMLNMGFLCKELQFEPIVEAPVGASSDKPSKASPKHE